MLFRSRYLRCGTALFFSSRVKTAGLVGLLFIFTMGSPRTTYGAMQYSALLSGGYNMSRLIERPIPEIQESLESVARGGVYRTQYTPPSTPPPSGQSSQGGVIVPDAQSRQSSSAIVPFITVSERYDTNVLFSTEVVADYITNVSPGVLWNFQSSLVEGSVNGTMITEKYVKNPGLSFIGTSGVINLGLDKMTGTVLRGWSLRLSDSVMYSPNMPTFLAPETGNQISSSYVRGVQAFRANSFSNIGTIISSYAMSPSSTMTATYSNQILRFFSSNDPFVSIYLYDVTTSILSVGPEFRVSSTQSVSVLYQFQDMRFVNHGSGLVTGAITNGGMPVWRARLSPAINMELGAGAIAVLSTGSVFGVGRVQLEYNTPLLRAYISFSRAAVPNYYVSGGVFMSDLVGVSATYNLTREWFLVGRYDYAKSVSTDGPPTRFESHGPTGSVNYRIRSNISASGSVAFFQQTQSNGIGGNTNTFNREVFMLSIRMEWN